MESIRKVDAGELSYEDVCRKLNTNIETGLDWNEANRRLQIVGHNELNVKQEESLLSKYIEQVAFHSFLMIDYYLINLISITFIFCLICSFEILSSYFYYVRHLLVFVCNNLMTHSVLRRLVLNILLQFFFDFIFICNLRPLSLLLRWHLYKNIDRKNHWKN